MSLTPEQQVRQRLQRVEGYRVSLIFAHGGMTILLGVLILQSPPGAYQGNAWHWLRAIRGGVATVGAGFLLGGLLITWGVLTRRAHAAYRILTGQALQMYGLALVAVCEATFACGFTWAHYAPPSEPGPRPPLYPLAVYAHLSIVMVLHILALRKQPGSLQAYAETGSVPIVMHLQPDSARIEQLIEQTRAIGLRATQDQQGQDGQP